MRQGRRIGTAGLLAAAVAISSAAWAEATPKVKIRGVITPPQVTAPVNMSITVYPAVQDNFGNFLPATEGVQNRFVYYDPKTPGRPADFELDLDVLKEYEVRVEVLDETGEPIKDRTYYFADITPENPEVQTALRTDTVVPVSLAFRCEPRSASKNNFISPDPSEAGGYVLKHYNNLFSVPQAPPAK